MINMSSTLGVGVFGRLVLRNGRIYTHSNPSERTEAIVVSDKRTVYVG